MQYQLDTRHLLCPMPVIRTQDRIAKLQEGDILTITSTDPGALFDIPAWAKVHAHHVVSVTTQEKEHRSDEYIVIVKVQK